MLVVLSQKPKGGIPNANQNVSPQANCAILRCRSRRCYCLLHRAVRPHRVLRCLVCHFCSDRVHPEHGTELHTPEALDVPEQGNANGRPSVRAVRRHDRFLPHRQRRFSVSNGGIPTYVVYRGTDDSHDGHFHPELHHLWKNF